MIAFYPWAFSGICRGELAALRDDHDKFRDLGVRVVAVSCDAMFTLRAYADAERIGFDLLTDHWPHGQIAKAYGVFDDQAGCALRGTFLLDAAGAGSAGSRSTGSARAATSEVCWLGWVSPSGS